VKRLLVLVVLACLGTASKCNPTPATPDAAAPATQDTAPTGVSCATACARAAALHCDYAAPSPKGVTCEQVCENAQSFQAWDLACRTKIKTCADVLGCQ
jgi:hypothetical protein